jgi:hypothetical protein
MVPQQLKRASMASTQTYPLTDKVPMPRGTPIEKLLTNRMSIQMLAEEDAAKK